MATLDARQIYELCREAGFSPNEAVTMTAVALAESSGNTDAHNPSGEDSWGLFQVNLDAHGSWTNAEALQDPLENVRAAFRISNGGKDISPWTVTHQRNGIPYARFRSDAINAAISNGDLGAVGYFEGSPGYGHATPASPGGVASLGDGVDDHAFGSPADHPPDHIDVPTEPDVDHFLYHALANVGDAYVYGAEAAFDDTDPDAFDCSELVQWAAHQAGVDVGDVAQYQFLRLSHGGGEMSVDEALHTPGALLFWFPQRPTDDNVPAEGHVAISLGDGRTVEARGRDYGVGVFETAGRRFTQAAFIPGMRYHTPEELARTPDLIDRIVHGLPPIDDGLPAPETPESGPDTHLNLDPESDNDGDGLSALLESSLGLRSDLDDTDGDGVSDSMELALGHDPTRPDAGSLLNDSGFGHDGLSGSLDHWSTQDEHLADEALHPLVDHLDD